MGEDGMERGEVGDREERRVARDFPQSVPPPSSPQIIWDLGKSNMYSVVGVIIVIYTLQHTSQKDVD